MSRVKRYDVISYLDYWSVPVRTKKKIEEVKQYFGFVVIWDFEKGIVATATPYNVYHIDPMITQAADWNRLDADRKLYLKEVREYVGG